MFYACNVTFCCIPFRLSANGDADPLGAIVVIQLYCISARRDDLRTFDLLATLCVCLFVCLCETHKGDILIASDYSKTQTAGE